MNINKNKKIWDIVKTITNDFEFICLNHFKLVEYNTYIKKYYQKYKVQSYNLKLINHI